MNDLEALMAKIAEVWKCDEARYPELAGMNDAQKKNFVIKHSVLHIAKTNGKIAALCEDFDHNGTDMSEEAKTLAVKLFINSLKLAEESGLSTSDLLSRAPNFVK